METNVGAKKRAGIVLILLGVILIVVPLVPSTTGASTDGVNIAKVVAMVAGGLIVLVGSALARKKGHRSDPS